MNLLSEAGRRSTADVQVQTTPIVARSFDRPILRDVSAPYGHWEDDDEPDELGHSSEADDDDCEGVSASENDEAYRAYVVAKIEEGLADFEAGRFFSDEEFENRREAFFANLISGGYR